MSLIELKNIRKEYQSGSGFKGEQVAAVNHISLKIEQAEFVSLMGPSGSGKSTLITIIGGLNTPTYGNLFVDDIDVYKLSLNALSDFRREYIGFVFQAFQLIPYLTVLENIIFPLSINNISRQEQLSIAYPLIEKVHLNNKANRLINDLSGGEQQRVAIARSLVNDPLIILADEPTGNLDSKTSMEIMDYFSQLNSEGKTIIMVTHNSGLKRYSTRNILLEDGNLKLDSIYEKQNYRESIVKDPVCGMIINEEDIAGSITYRGTKYFFCAPCCEVSFKKDPEKYTMPIMFDI